MLLAAYRPIVRFAENRGRMPDAVTVSTAWLAMATLGAGAAVALRSGVAAPTTVRASRWLWTAACGMLWIHVACAFQFQHHWSHAEAHAHTAGKTAEYVGLDWGGGLYFNYLLMAVWTGDVAWWWIAPRSYADRPVAIGLFVWGFVVFMAFNATVVFGSGVLRWLALVVFAALGVCLIRRLMAKALQ